MRSFIVGLRLSKIALNLRSRLIVKLFHICEQLYLFYSMRAIEKTLFLSIRIMVQSMKIIPCNLGFIEILAFFN